MDVIVHDDLFVMRNDACALRAAPVIGTVLKVRLYIIQSQLNKEPTDAFDEDKETEELEVDWTRRKRLICYIIIHFSGQYYKNLSDPCSNQLRNERHCVHSV
jgi:hypothetical protein